MVTGGGGYLARAVIVESRGVITPAENPSPESVAETIAPASDLSQAVAHPNLNAAFDAVRLD